MRQLFRIGPIVFLTGLLVVLFAQSDPAEKSARTVLEARCVACHGAARMSDLDLRERDTILKGGSAVPPLSPARPTRACFTKQCAVRASCRCPPAKLP